MVTWLEMYGVAQSDTVQFLHNPMVYGVACLLYGVATSDSVLEIWAGSDVFPSLWLGLGACSFFLSMCGRVENQTATSYDGRENSN